MIALVNKANVGDPYQRNPSTGFSWWYFDIVDEFGNGAVVIWSQNLPFLPTSKRLDHADSQRPSLNVVLYQHHKTVFYLFQEYPPSEIEWSPAKGYWRFGETIIRQIDSDDTIELNINLNAPIPTSASHIVGTIQFSGPKRKDLPLNDFGFHHWSPVSTNCTGHVDLQDDKAKYAFSGRCYHDSNSSSRPIQNLGIEKWWWGRFSFPDQEVVLYLVSPETDTQPINMLLNVDNSGHMSSSEITSIQFQDPQKSLFGLHYPQSLFVASGAEQLMIEPVHLLDDSPFYQRFMATATRGEQTSVGYLEQVAPPRIGLFWQQPFVRMKVHDLNGSNSMWLPLFTGNRTDSFWKQLSRCTPF